MRNHQALSSLVAVVLFGVATFSAGTARADDSTCQMDTDCGKGWSCQVVGGTACASGAPACPPGAPCEAPPPCVNSEIKACVPAGCSSDTDCADGMVCFGYPTPCPGIACPPGAACDPPVCDPGPKQCTPKYDLPCVADADCGGGFTCEFGQECSGGSASGSAGTPANPGSAGSAGSAGGGLPVPLPTTCMTSSTGSCQLTPVTCKNNLDCQAGWSCLNVAPGYGCAEAGSAGGAPSNGGGAIPIPVPSGGAAGAAGAPGSGGFGGDISIDCPPPPAPMMQCVPPSNSSDYLGSNDGAPTTTTGSGGATSSGSSGSLTPATPTANAGPSGTDSAGATTSTSCAVAVPGAAGNGTFALLALGLVGFLRRRRVVRA
jgi:MYXO-CTERM domain-containing protein